MTDADRQVTISGPGGRAWFCPQPANDKTTPDIPSINLLRYVSGGEPVPLLVVARKQGDDSNIATWDDDAHAGFERLQVEGGTDA